MKWPALLMRLKAYVPAMTIANSSGLVPSLTGWIGAIRESFPGAWQSGITIDGPRDILSFSAAFACITGIAGDVAKLAIELKELSADGIGKLVVATSPYWAVLLKPNHYQTRPQFVEQWIISKLLHGNTYVLKARDGRGIVDTLYVLDARRVKPLVAQNGDVYYQLYTDFLSGVDQNVTVPASEIIHDRWNCLWHSLVGISPLYACALSATQGNRIQMNSTRFFMNASRPSGVLTAPGTIDDVTAKRLKEEWENNFSGNNIGRMAVLGDGLKYEAMTIPAQLAQLIEQLKWTKEDCATPFHYPLFKLGGPIPVGSTVEALNQTYYADCIQTLLESAEACLDDGLGLNGLRYYTEFDISGLLRMDTMARNNALGELVKTGIMAPNEARAVVDLDPVTGGKSPYLQQQNFSLEALAKRDALPNPFVIDRPTPNPTPSATGPAATADPNASSAKQLADALIRRLKAGAVTNRSIERADA